MDATRVQHWLTELVATQGERIPTAAWMQRPCAPASKPAPHKLPTRYQPIPRAHWSIDRSVLCPSRSSQSQNDATSAPDSVRSGRLA